MVEITMFALREIHVCDIILERHYEDLSVCLIQYLVS